MAAPIIEDQKATHKRTGMTHFSPLDLSHKCCWNYLHSHLRLALYQRFQLALAPSGSVYSVCGATQLVGLDWVDETELGKAEPRFESDGYAGPCSAMAGLANTTAAETIKARHIFTAP